MAKQTLQTFITVEDWINLSGDRAIQQRISNDPYSMVYPGLLTHFKGIKTLDWEAAVLGLHIVYGWMPTIPKLGQITKWDEQKKGELVTCLTDARNGVALNDSQLQILMDFCNNSIVGGSKLLHFLNSEKFPIWDSRVAKAFLLNPKAQGQQVNSITAWKNYRVTLGQWQAELQVNARCSELRKLAIFLDGATDFRLVELVMFHKTESKRKQGHKT